VSENLRRQKTRLGDCGGDDPCPCEEGRNAADDEAEGLFSGGEGYAGDGGKHIPQIIASGWSQSMCGPKRTPR
jgi:hypothetical protein